MEGKKMFLEEMLLHRLIRNMYRLALVYPEYQMKEGNTHLEQENYKPGEKIYKHMLWTVRLFVPELQLCLRDWDNLTDGIQWKYGLCYEESNNARNDFIGSMNILEMTQLKAKWKQEFNIAKEELLSHQAKVLLQREWVELMRINVF